MGGERGVGRLGWMERWVYGWAKSEAGPEFKKKFFSNFN
jgi:hypothetical protein